MRPRPLATGAALLALAALAALPLPAAAQSAGASASAPPSAVDKCLADHVAAQEARLDGHLLRARDELRSCSQATCPGPVAAACADLLRDVEPRVASLLVTAREADGTDVVDGALSLDGQPLPVAEWGRARDVDPGKHDLSLERGGKVIARATVVIAEGEKSRRVDLRVAPAAAPTTTPTPASPWRVPGAIGVGLGLGALVGTGVLGGLAKAEYDDLKKRCAPDCTEPEIAGARTKAIAADVLLASGLVLVTAGALALLLPRPAPASPEPKPAAARLYDVKPFVIVGERGAFAGITLKAF